MRPDRPSSCKPLLSSIFRAKPRFKSTALRSPASFLLASLLLLSSSSLSFFAYPSVLHLRTRASSPFSFFRPSSLLSLRPRKGTMQSSSDPLFSSTPTSPSAPLSSSPSSSPSSVPPSSSFSYSSGPLASVSQSPRENNFSMQDARGQKSEGQKPKRPPPPPPTHFLAVQLSSPTLHSTIASIQEEIIKTHGPKLKEVMVAPSKLHLTLVVLHLEEEEEEGGREEEEEGWMKEAAVAATGEGGNGSTAVNSAVTIISEEAVIASAALAAAAAEATSLNPSLPPSLPKPTVARTRALISSLMQEEIRPRLLREYGGRAPSLRLVGLGSFGEKVVFVRPEEEEEGEGGREGGKEGGTRWMQRVVMRMSERLFEEGLTRAKPLRRVEEVKLHATVAKMSRRGGGRGRGRGRKGGREGPSLLRREVWVKHDERWGLGGEEQVLEAVQMLEMRGDGEGYYELVEEWRFF